MNTIPKLKDTTFINSDKAIKFGEKFRLYLVTFSFNLYHPTGLPVFGNFAYFELKKTPKIILH